jgi:hypothetical protein
MIQTQPFASIVSTVVSRSRKTITVPIARILAAIPDDIIGKGPYQISLQVDPEAAAIKIILTFPEDPGTVANIEMISRGTWTASLTTDAPSEGVDRVTGEQVPADNPNSDAKYDIDHQ